VAVDVGADQRADIERDGADGRMHELHDDQGMRIVGNDGDVPVDRDAGNSVGDGAVALPVKINRAGGLYAGRASLPPFF